MTGNEKLRVLGRPPPPSSSQATRRKTRRESMTGDSEKRACEFRGPPTPPSSSQAARIMTRGDDDGRQNLAISRDPWHHHPALKLQEGKQEQIIMGDKTWPFPGPSAPPSGSQAATRETRRDNDGKQELTSSREPRHHHPVPKLQEERQKEIMTGENLRVFGTPRHHHPVPKPPRRETRGDYDGRQELASSRDARQHHPVPTLQEKRQEEIIVWGTMGQKAIIKGDKSGDTQGTPADPPAYSGSPDTHNGTRGNYEGRQIGRQARHPGTSPRSPEAKTGTRGDCEGRQIGRHAMDPSTPPSPGTLFFTKLRTPTVNCLGN